MSDYRIFETTRFQKDLKNIFQGSLPNIQKKLKDYVYPQLIKQPHFGLNIKRLKGYIPSTWRYRVTQWRFFYEIDDNKRVIFMTAAEHRSRAY